MKLCATSLGSSFAVVDVVLTARHTAVGWKALRMSPRPLSFTPTPLPAGPCMRREHRASRIQVMYMNECFPVRVAAVGRGLFDPSGSRMKA